MTSQTAQTAVEQSHLGTISVIAWSGENIDDGRDMAFLLAYSLGDGSAGPEAGEKAVRALLEQTGLPVGGGIFDGSKSKEPISLLLESGSASLTMPSLRVQCLVPEEWTAAALKRKHVHFIFTTRPWPGGTPGVPVDAEDLKAFVADEEVIAASAHCVIPVTTLRK
ncbi:hypothetical protein AR457_17035 [Streptomyces agglomeratus]|uniref:DUF5949 family protein n=1 Tax=Streptomyces agglomeratus TaxID=285458 RepID=UPI000853FA2B|nr:DUF5949 family protein [Streptomyces agglomeratus]OEJ40034.1 hypothetical protein BGK70_19615 [Streptomyces agglomeratus]OEJ45586.1 hypothetical protein AR457_17035 [Streptomyces agglomeratus]